MAILFWLAMAAFAATLVWVAWYVRRKSEERRIAEEARAAAFMMDFAGAQKSPAGTVPAAAPLPSPAPAAQPTSAPASDNALQKLLFEAAHKAGEAGEPALAIQLYARLLARYPATAFAGPAHEAVEAQKKKLLKDR